MESISKGANYIVATKWGNMQYAKYIQRVIQDRDDGLLNTFGKYVQGMSNELVSTDVKCFLLLESIFQEPDLREAFIYTSSDLLVEHMEELVDRFRRVGDDEDGEEKASVGELHGELVELMLDYLDGC
jgi:predicted NAD-dependent protein-ADP-ribosyltransferase YbiA (DUF1768 family)